MRRTKKVRILPQVRPPGLRPGFTLIEALVVLAILSLLFAIILPAIAGVRGTAGRVSSLSAMRGLYQAVTLYGQDFRSFYPYFGTPGLPDEPLRINGARMETNAQLHLSHHFKLWSSGIEPYLSGTPDSSLGPAIRHFPEHEGVVRQEIFFSPFRMSMTAFTRPEFWRLENRGFSASQITGARSTEVRWPARKVLLSVPDVPGILNTVGDIDPQKMDRWFACMAEGSVSTRTWLGPRKNIIAPFSVEIVTFPYWLGNTTEDGLQGTDF